MHATRPDLTIPEREFITAQGTSAWTVEHYAQGMNLSAAAASAALAQMARDRHLSRHPLLVATAVSGHPPRLLYRAACTDAPLNDLSDGSDVSWAQPWPQGSRERASDVLARARDAAGQPAAARAELNLRRAAWQLCVDFGALDTNLELHANALMDPPPRQDQLPTPDAGRPDPSSGAVHAHLLTLLTLAEHALEHDPKRCAAALYGCGMLCG